MTLASHLESHGVSVPHSLIRPKVAAGITARTVARFPRGQRVAAPARPQGTSPRHGTPLDRPPPPAAAGAPLLHPNSRGPRYRGPRDDP